MDSDYLFGNARIPLRSLFELFGTTPSTPPVIWGIILRDFWGDILRGRAKRVFEKSHTGAIRFRIRRIEVRSIIVSEVCTRYS